LPVHEEETAAIRRRRSSSKYNGSGEEQNALIVRLECLREAMLLFLRRCDLEHERCNRVDDSLQRRISSSFSSSSVGDQSAAAQKRRVPGGEGNRFVAAAVSGLRGAALSIFACIPTTTAAEGTTAMTTCVPMLQAAQAALLSSSLRLQVLDLDHALQQSWHEATQWQQPTDACSFVRETFIALQQQLQTSAMTAEFQVHVAELVQLLAVRGSKTMLRTQQQQQHFSHEPDVGLYSCGTTSALEALLCLEAVFGIECDDVSSLLLYPRLVVHLRQQQNRARAAMLLLAAAAEQCTRWSAASSHCRALSKAYLEKVMQYSITFCVFMLVVR
jgi:hypothetical protein